MIHLGFGIEFKQPAIIAEALAQAAVHDAWISPYLLKTEAASTKPSSRTLPDLIEEIRTNKKLVDSVHWEDDNKIRDGILKRAPQEMVDICKQWTVFPDQLEEKTAEMINAAVYFAAASQHPPKRVSLLLPSHQEHLLICLRNLGQIRFLLHAQRKQLHLLPHLQLPTLALAVQQSTPLAIQRLHRPRLVHIPRQSPSSTERNHHLHPFQTPIPNPRLRMGWNFQTAD